MVIGKDPGESTMIRVTYEVKEMIEEEKIVPREPLNDCIKRGILENRQYRKNRIEDREKLLRCLEGNTLNPEVPGTKTLELSHREIYEKLTGEQLSSDDIIHHKNGFHNDDTPENLMKTTRQKHVSEHIKIGILPCFGPTKTDKIVGKDV